MGRALKILTVESTEKRSSGTSRRRKEDNIRWDLREIGVDSRNWVDSVQDRDF